MTDLLQEPQCSEPGPPESQTMTEFTETLADLCGRVAALGQQEAVLGQRVAALEALARKRPVSRSSAYWIGRRNVPRMTRPDRCPFGWKPDPSNPALLIQDGFEQHTIWYLIEAAQNPAMGPRALCRFLDSRGCKRRGGKRWAGAHSLVTSILKRHSAETPAAATLRIRERIAAMQARAADR